MQLSGAVECSLKSEGDHHTQEFTGRISFLQELHKVTFVYVGEEGVVCVKAVSSGIKKLDRQHSLCGPSK